MALKGEQTGLNVELTELLSGADVLTRMDYKKLANEPQRPLLYCQHWPGEESRGQAGQVMARDEPGRAWLVSSLDSGHVIF